MPVEPIVTFPGILNIISCSYTRGHGISPGFATITCTPQEEWPDRQGSLKFEYGGISREYPDCVTDNLSFSFDSSGQLWRLMVMDRRWKWRYGFINGRYNVRLPNGPVDKLDPRTEKTPYELIRMLLDQMGEDDAVIGRLPKLLRPSISWDHANPAQELANLCDQFGMSIILDDDDVVAIFPRGWGDLAGTRRSEFSREQVIADSGSSDPPELPDKVTFVCGPSRFQVDYPLDCVNDDIDGLVKPIEVLSYAPKGKDAAGNLTKTVDWTRADLVNFSNITLFNPADPTGVKWYNYASPRELARAGMFKKYRVRVWTLRGVRAITNAPGYPIEGFAEAVGEENPRYPYDIRFVLPMGAELVEPAFDTVTGWFRPLNCIVWGWFAPGGGVKNNVTSTDIEGFNEATWDTGSNDVQVPMIYQARDATTGALVPSYNATVIPPDQYSLDSDTGIFNFSNRIVRAAYDTDPASRTLKAAVLWARITVTICDDETLVPIREEVDFDITDIEGFEDADVLGTATMVIRDDDIFLRVQPQYVDTAPEVSMMDPIDNRDFINDYARERVTMEMRKFQTVGARSVTYAGIVRADMSGDIVQVNFNVGPGGCTTTIALNSEIAALVIPYSERRFLEKIRNEKLDGAMQVYNKMLFEMGFAFSKSTNLMRTGR
jgi:hypothetical protein